MSKSQLFSLIEYKARELSREQALRDLKVKLGPCYRYGDKILATLFYEIYLGSDNIMKLYGLKPRYVKASDFINHERIITTKSSLSFLKRKIPKGLAIITGRSKRLTKIMLNPVLRYFRLMPACLQAIYLKPMRSQIPKS